MKKVISKLFLLYLMLILFVMLFANFIPQNRSMFEFWENSDELFFIFQFVFKNILICLIPAILATVYSLLIFQIIKKQRKWELWMVLNTIIMMILSFAVVMIICFCTSWFSLSTVVIMTRTITVIGLLTIVLFLIFKKLKSDFE